MFLFFIFFYQTKCHFGLTCVAFFYSLKKALKGAEVVLCAMDGAFLGAQSDAFLLTLLQLEP